MEEHIDIQLLDTPLSLADCVQFVTHPEAGGLALFIGNVRNATQGKSVKHLEFEAYAPMAIKEMHKIAQDIQHQWPAVKVAIHHRIGQLQITDTAVIIAVACPHRAAAFTACQYAIDTLKETVPIWKKEFFADGAIWVAAHP
jgi:molybdopterin synthase catalytic subunit